MWCMKRTTNCGWWSEAARPLMIAACMARRRHTHTHTAIAATKQPLVPTTT